MSPANYWKIGLFVMSGLAVALAALVVLGGRQLNKRVQKFDLYFNETVDGLSVGSEVRLRGIPVGNVVDISLAPDRVLVHVTIEVFEATVERLGARPLGEAPEEAATRAREMGLCAELVRNPLTGLAIINVDIFPSAEPQKFDFDPGKDFIYTVPSTLEGIVADASKMIDELPKLIDDVRSLLRRVDQAITDLQVSELSADARELMKTANREIGGLDLAALQAETTRTLEEVRTALHDAGAEIESARLGELSATARRTLEAATGTADAATALAGDLRADLPHLRRLADKLRQLADLLERDPAALLRGKKPSRVLGGDK